MFVPALAWEMNRCRHVVAAQARAFADRGWDVLCFDLLGTGDSSGDFGDATWDAWLADIDSAAVRLREQADGDLCIWGMRGGCLLASDWLNSRNTRLRAIFWQPVLQGSQHLQHMLRMRLASGLLGKSGQRESVGELRSRLQREGSLEIGGFTFAAGLTSGLERVDLAALPGGTPIVWLEVGAPPDPALTPASESCIARLRSAGCEVAAKAVTGSAFWQTVERDECPTLLDATLSMTEHWP